MRRQTRCVGHEAGFGNDPSELQAKSTSIRERSSSLGQTIHRPRRDDRRSSPYQAQCSGTFVDDASAIGFWERLVQVNRLAIQANSFTEMECVFVGSGRIVGNSEVTEIWPRFGWPVKSVVRWGWKTEYQGLWSPTLAAMKLRQGWGTRRPAAGLLVCCGRSGQSTRLPPWLPARPTRKPGRVRSEEHTSELQSLRHLVCRLLLEKK